MKDWSKIDPLLGKQSDLSLSKKFGRNQSAVSARRRSKNIPAFKYKKVDWKEWNHRLGKQSDYSLAKEIGTSIENVHHHRTKLKIKKYKG